MLKYKTRVYLPGLFGLAVYKNKKFYNWVFISKDRKKIDDLSKELNKPLTLIEKKRFYAEEPK